MPDYYARNEPYLASGPTSVRVRSPTYNTVLAPLDEMSFRVWLQNNNVPFNPDAHVSDYDMRGFWQALQQGDPRAVSAIDPNDNRLHYPDVWKTPYHQTFSAESQWASPNAPQWNAQDQLVAGGARILFDDRVPRPSSPVTRLQDVNP